MVSRVLFLSHNSTADSENCFFSLDLNCPLFSLKPHKLKILFKSTVLNSVCNRAFIYVHVCLSFLFKPIFLQWNSVLESEMIWFVYL